MRSKKKMLAEVLVGRPPRPPHETAPMMVNDISHLFFAKVRSMEPEGVLSQHSARVILRLLITRDGMRQNELADAAHLSAPTVSATLRRMESEGLIERRACEHDGRAVGVYLTEQGRLFHGQMLHMLHTVDEILMQGFDAEEKEGLCAMLERMRQNLVHNMQHTADEEAEK